MDMKMKIGQENMLMNTEAETLEIIQSPAEEDDDIKQAAYEEASRTMIMMIGSMTHGTA